VAAGVDGDKSQAEDDDAPEWLLNLLAKSLRQTIGDDNDSRRTKSVKLSASLSQLPQRSTHERDTAAGVDEDDGLAVRRQRLEVLARRLAAIDDLRRGDDGGQEVEDRKYDGGYDQPQAYRSSAPSSDRKYIEDFATKKRLLAKWLQEAC